MNLYATGFNAWRQLEFPPLEDSTREPDDVPSFRKVLSDELIEIQYTSLTCTIVNTSVGLKYAGFLDENAKSGLEQKLLSHTAAVAENGTVAIYDGHSTITQYDSLLSSVKTENGRAFSGMDDIIQLVAYETGFVALSRHGKVWSWGDERYAASLGREITMSSPACRPGLVEDLEGLPSGRIKRVAAAGYTTLALTEGNDLYAWGGHPARHLILETLSNIPNLVDVEEKDILDFSVGEMHMIVLDVDGGVYVSGDNTNGQLGLPVERISAWKKVPLSLRGEIIVGIKAGKRSSFIVTKNTHVD
ncbi:regulator of chromosome condensation 1/beta-lactamase-inhibitor protein II [Xylaria sp. CBS 124048]|nr:regulator of chromosome condensation 1/beta-lactamase-inhibitor protein II [Xylaria sp. CBS 124048]